MAGEIGLLGGATGEAKSQIASHLAAVVTAGKELAPDNVPEKSALGKVIYFVGERSIERVVVPRLKLAGADLDKVAVIGRRYRGKRLTAERMLAIVRAERDARLVIVDHVGRFFPAANTAGRVNDLLEPFETFADLSGITFIFVLQALKNPSARTELGVLQGSGAWTQAAAFVLQCGLKADGQGLLRFSKVSIGQRCGFEFAVVSDENELSHVEVGERRDDIDMTEFLGLKTFAGQGDDKGKAWLLSYLERGERPYRELEDAFRRETKLSKRTLDRIKAELGIKSRWQGRTMYWELPVGTDGSVGTVVENNANDAKDAKSAAWIGHLRRATSALANGERSKQQCRQPTGAPMSEPAPDSAL
jgi:hypothetical protein